MRRREWVDEFGGNQRARLEQVDRDMERLVQTTVRCVDLDPLTHVVGQIPKLFVRVVLEM